MAANRREEQVVVASDSEAEEAGPELECFGYITDNIVGLQYYEVRACFACGAAAADRYQTSMNLAFGSALASIGLTIPVVAIAAVQLGFIKPQRHASRPRIG